MVSRVVGCVSISKGINHPAAYAIESLELALASINIRAVPGITSLIIRRLARYAAKLGFVRRVRAQDRGAVIVPLMGLQEAATVPYCWSYEIIPFIWDCFTPEYSRWHGFFRRHKVRLAFFTARQSCEYFGRVCPDMRCEWIPEATRPESFDSRKLLSERAIDVLEFGRRYERYHTAIASGLLHSGYKHLYQKEGRLVFRTKKDFVSGLSNSKISICFPSSITHPERSGDVETATHRYFESMASGCLLVGHAPRELPDIIGFNPVIEADLERPVEQLRQILGNLSSYDELRERNLLAVRSLGSWDARAIAMLQCFNRYGYEI